jgi:hypothetical protein
MTRTEELLALAEAAMVLDHNEQEGWYEADFIKECGAYYPKNARFIAAANPETIRQLVELVRLQNAALEFAADFIPTSYCNIGDCMVCETIEAFNKWENGK